MASEKNFKNWLRRPQDALIFCIWLLFGLLPSFLFFFWIERNCTLPYIPQKLGWPWLITDGTAMDAVLINSALILLFGVIHSIMAIPRIRNTIFFGSHEKNHRALYVTVTGLSCIAVMGHWQSTGIVIYSLFQDSVLTSVVSFLLFWVWMFMVFRVGESLDVFTFLGWTDLVRSPNEWTKNNSQQAPTEILVTTGIFRYVRHPIYSFTLLAIILTPFLSLDRLVVFTMFFVYIIVGYRLEERKLVQKFGASYIEYRKKTPALFPTL